jgi:hypothetical protein
MGREKPTDDLAKDVFAHFGAAYYHAEVLHRGLCNLYVWTKISAIGPMNRYRIEEHLAKAFSTTLGQLVGEIKICFSEDEFEALDVAVSKRNFLAHHFWFERVHLMSSADGCRALIAELNAAEKLFKETDNLVDMVAAPYLAKTGLSPDVLAEALAEALRGEPMEPLRSQRRLKKKELVSRAYELAGAGGAMALYFETDDGAIWQLCDVGLGWTATDTANPGWPPSSLLNQFLPATIDPRPQLTAPWHYDMELSGATLVVRPGKPGGPFSFSVRRKK